MAIVSWSREGNPEAIDGTHGAIDGPHRVIDGTHGVTDNSHGVTDNSHETIDCGLATLRAVLQWRLRCLRSWGEIQSDSETHQRAAALFNKQLR